MRIDAHQHVFWDEKTDSGLLENMDQFGIDQAWVLSWEVLSLDEDASFPPGQDPTIFHTNGVQAGLPFSDVVKASAHYPKRLIPGFCPHPQVGDAAARFEAAVNLYGVRVCGEFKFRITVDDPRCLELFRKAGELGCPVILHFDAPYLWDEAAGKPAYQKQWYGGTMENFERALRACPQTNFLGHAPGFWREISGDADRDSSGYPKGKVVPGGRLWGMFEKHANLYGDISAGSGLNALKRDPEHARKFLETFSDRLLYGRDTHNNLQVEFLDGLNLSKKTLDRIYFENAQRLIRNDNKH